MERSIAKGYQGAQPQREATHAAAPASGSSESVIKAASMAGLRRFYFLYFAALATYMPFLILYYRQIGLSERQIGLLAALPPLTTMVASPLCGLVADRTQRHKQMLLLALGGSLAAVLALSQAPSFVWLVPIVVLFALFGSPIMPLVDNTVLDLLGKDRRQYGKQRLWGTIGWGVAAVVAGVVTERLGLRWAFWGYLILGLASLVVMWPVEVSCVATGASFWRHLRRMMASRRWLVFLGTAFLFGISFTLVGTFLFLHLEELGASRTLMGFASLAATASELPVLFFSDRLLRRWGTRGLLTTALVVQVVRLFAYSLVAAPWQVLAIQLLHGPGFGAMLVAAVQYVDDFAPEELGGTAQGLFTAVTFGLGGAVGALMGGIVYQALGGAELFRVAALAPAAALVLFILASKGAQPARVGVYTAPSKA